MGENFDMRENPIQSKIREDIAAQGWSWIWVFDPDGESPSFAYTIGFKATFGRPETVVVGLPEGTSEGVLSSVCAELESGASFSDGDVSDDVLEAFSVRFMAVSEDFLSNTLTQATEFYGGQNFEALQLYWPDGDGNFPGDKNAPSWLNERQRLRA